MLLHGAIELGIALGIVVLLCLAGVLFGHWIDHCFRMTPSNSRKYLLQMVRSGRMEHIGAMVDVLDRTDPALQSVIVGELTRRLRRFKPGYASLLTGAQYERLYKHLTWDNLVKQKRRFLRTILKMAETLDDTAALPYVERFIYEGQDMQGVEGLRASAEACRLRLTKVAEVARERRTLLRPTPAPIEPLLRPAHGAPDPHPEQLLRTAAPPEDEP